MVGKEVTTIDRRTVLRTAGALSVAGVAGLAGCGGDGGGDGDGTTTTETTDGGTTTTGDGGVSVEDYPAVDEWLTETEVGDADDSYDGSIVDSRDQDQVTVEVGSAGNGDNFAFGPSAVAVSAGTEVLWDWTGEGGLHNVEAEPDEQIGESDYEFSSGEPVEGADNEFRMTFDEAGVALYHCEPHLSVGMKGAIVVV